MRSSEDSASNPRSALRFVLSGSPGLETILRSLRAYLFPALACATILFTS
jgi:hypothetical protein